MLSSLPCFCHIFNIFILAYIAYLITLFFYPLYLVACVLPGVKGWLMFQFLFGIIILVAVVPFTLVELVRLHHELTRNKGMLMNEYGYF